MAQHTAPGLLPRAFFQFRRDHRVNAAQPRLASAAFATPDVT